MSALIAVGIGNTTIKLGVVDPATDQWQLMHEWDTAEFDLSEVADELPKESCRWRVASVQRAAEQTLRQWQQRTRSQDDYLAFSYKDLALTLNVNYPERVGMDRLIAAVAVNERRERNRPAIIVGKMSECVTQNAFHRYQLAHDIPFDCLVRQNM